MNRREPADDGSAEVAALRAQIVTIERVTGHKPPMCPWRVFSEPCVREVLDVSWAAQDGGGALPAIIGTDPPAALAKGISVYRKALTATDADERRIREIERAAEKRAKDAMRKARG